MERSEIRDGVAVMSRGYPGLLDGEDAVASSGLRQIRGAFDAPWPAW
jgi:hypothetical protein